MRNLKTEILSVLAVNNKTPEDIKWVGSQTQKIPLDVFWKLADVIYDDGYGSPQVAVDLVVVGEDFWLERHEYDGAEWFEFKTAPIEPLLTMNNCQALTVGQHNRVFQDTSVGWQKLLQLNTFTEEDREWEI